MAGTNNHRGLTYPTQVSEQKPCLRATLRTLGKEFSKEVRTDSLVNLKYGKDLQNREEESHKQHPAANELRNKLIYKPEVPNQGYMYPYGCIYVSEGVHLWLAIEG